MTINSNLIIIVLYIIDALRELNEVDQSLFIHLSEKVHTSLIAVVVFLVVKNVQGDKRGEKTCEDERVKQVITCII